MTNDMLDPSDLAYLPGAPFTEQEVDDAVEAIRNAAGWHIAPERVDSAVPLDVVHAEPVLRLPTRKLVSVEEVRNADTGAAVDAARYRVSRARGRIRRRSGFWPAGYEAVEVDFTHGYEECPADLKPVVGQYILASRRDSSVRSVRVDDASVDYQAASTNLTPTSPSVAALAGYQVLRRYSLPEFAGIG